MSKSELCKTAYEYIKGQAGKLQGLSFDVDHPLTIPLNELLLKEGLADPSAELVASLKQLLRGSVTEAEIDAHFVVPFQQHRVD